MFVRPYCQRVHDEDALDINEFRRMFTLVAAMKTKLECKVKGQLTPSGPMIGLHPQSWYRTEWCSFIAKLWAAVFTGTSKYDPYELLPSETRDIKRYPATYKMSLCNYCMDTLFPELIMKYLFYNVKEIHPPPGSPPDFQSIVLPNQIGKFCMILFHYVIEPEKNV